MFIHEIYKKYQLRKRRKELLNAIHYVSASDDDLLSPDTKTLLRQLENDVQKSDTDLDRCEQKLDQLLKTQNFSRKMRNFLDVLIVACTVAGGIRALAVQPFRIPTSSMQPTLFGIHYVDRAASRPFMGPITRLVTPIQSSRAFVRIREDGAPTTEYNMRSKHFFWNESAFRIGSQWYTVPGDYLSQILRYLPKVNSFYKKGDIFCDGWLSTGDHVFVERFSIYFRPLKRGDVIVFNTENISSPTQPIEGYYYIKRLVGLPGDTLQIAGNILMLRPKGETKFRPIWEFSEAFQKLYSGKGGYQGHRADGLLDLGGELTVPEGHFFALGDNTNFSLDGRNWGFIPRKNIIGLAVMIFWPVSRRWGLVDRQGPVDTPTLLQDTDRPFFQPDAMSMQ